MMMSRRLSTLLSVLLVASASPSAGAQDASATATVTSTESALNSCPPVKEVLNKGYHSDETCNRKYFNEYKDNVRRDHMYQSLKKDGGAVRVPNMKTVTCPVGGQPVDLNQQGSRQGYDTTWFVENTASTPVVLAYLDMSNGIEYSAVDSSITPPTADPKAILKPGEWTAIWTHEGHVFHARELLGTGNAMTMGRVVLQHRTGLYPIGEGVTGLTCPEVDQEPLTIDNELQPEFARTDLVGLRRCNQIDIGFRNAANCPLNGYYIPHYLDAAIDESTSCAKEEFKLHLGLEPSTPDFHWDWKSNTKFEGTAVGHSFVFRLASNPAVLVDTVTLEPTKIIDCPMEQTVAEVEVSAGAIITSVHRLLPRHVGGTNATNLLDYYANATTTTLGQRFEAEAASGSRYGAASTVSF